jgi:cytochrome o ubiquinol oxidase subunit 1
VYEPIATFWLVVSATNTGLPPVFSMRKPCVAVDWELKQAHKKASTAYSDIHLPKNSGYGVYIAAAAFVFGFAVIWHIWWLALIAIVVLIGLAIASTLRTDTERTISADEVAATEKRLRGAHV